MKVPHAYEIYVGDRLVDTCRTLETAQKRINFWTRTHRRLGYDEIVTLKPVERPIGKLLKVSK